MEKSEEKPYGVASIKEVDDTSSTSDLVELEGGDDVLSEKMRLVNNALDEIGFTPYHLKLFFLNGMGYATDSQLSYVESNVRTFINYQFGYLYPVSNECAYAGLLVGVLFWGAGADVIGRKLAFNLSLLLSAFFTILCGVMNNMASYCIMVFLANFACGGNLALDTCVFLEYLPHKDHWLLTFFALFWGIGQVVAVLLAWAFLPNHSCSSEAFCPSHENRGWRYTYYVNGCIVLAMAILRVTIIRLKETPKFLVSNKRDAEAVEILHGIAKKYNRTCSLTLEELESCGEIQINHNYQESQSVKGIMKLVWNHITLLFSSKKNTRSTLLLFASWFFLGIAYPLYSSFLPVYLATRGANISASDTYGVYRDNVIANVCSIFGPVIAGLMLYYLPILGHKGVLAFGGLTTMALLFGYTAIKTRAQNVALSSTSFIALYIYYGCLYSYTPSVFGTSNRATGNSLCFVLTRFAGLFTPVIAYYSNTSSATPIYVCAAVVGIIGLVALGFPYEPSKHRAV